MKNFIGVMLLVGGCASTIQIDRGQFALVYADLKAQYAVARLRVEQLCNSKNLEEADCNRAKELHEKAVAIDTEVRRLLTEPSKQPDWTKIGDYTKILLGLVSKAAI